MFLCLQANHCQSEAVFSIENSRTLSTDSRILTPDGNVDGEVGISKSIGSLAGISSSVGLNRIRNSQFGGDPVQLADFGGAGFAGQSQIILAIFAPFYAAKKSLISD